VSNKEQLMARIDVALENIRPYLAADGGGITLVDITDDMTVLVELTGACTSCSMSSMTMKAGVESTIKTAVPEVQRVEAIS
jgi:Fe-S cluster biogenesis protein NfuA